MLLEVQFEFESEWKRERGFQSPSPSFFSTSIQLATDQFALNQLLLSTVLVSQRLVHSLSISLSLAEIDHLDRATCWSVLVSGSSSWNSSVNAEMVIYKQLESRYGLSIKRVAETWGGNQQVSISSSSQIVIKQNCLQCTAAHISNLSSDK